MVNSPPHFWRATAGRGAESHIPFWQYLYPSPRLGSTVIFQVFSKVSHRLSLGTLQFPGLALLTNLKDVYRRAQLLFTHLLDFQNSQRLEQFDTTHKVMGSVQKRIFYSLHSGYSTFPNLRILNGELELECSHADRPKSRYIVSIGTPECLGA